MSAERWQQVNDLFLAALEVDPSRRHEFLLKQCDDPSVLEEVTSLLSAHQNAGAFIQTSVSLLDDLLQQENAESMRPGEMIRVYRIVKEIGRQAMKIGQNRDQLVNQAVANITKSIDLNPQEINAYLELARLCRRLSEWSISKGKDAMNWIDRGLDQTVKAEEIYPNHPEMLAIRGSLLKLKSQISNDPASAKEGAELLQRTLQQNPFLKFEYQE